jgi:TIR domain
MAVAYGCAYDTFLSYAHIDDLPVPGSSVATGWVSAFHETLENEVRQRLGRKDVALWKDDELRYDQSLSRQLTETVRTSAILVVMLSPGYVSSDWCRRERNAFLEAIRSRGEAPVLVIAKEPMPDEALPAELRDRKRFPFYGGRDNITFGHPLPNPDNPAHAPFYLKILELSRAIADVLTKMTSPSPSRALPEPGLPDHPQKPLFRTSVAASPQLIGRRVFLAETTDDLEEERDGVRAFLDQHGIEVLPAAGVYYPPEAIAFREAVEKDLHASDVFVQLLSASRGKRPRDVPQGYPNLQWELATGTSARSIPVLQWCSPSLDICAVKDEHLGTLLRSPTVRAESLVDFERAIISALTLRTAEPIALGPSLVCVNVDNSDRHLAEQIQSILRRLKTEFVSIWFGGSSPDNRELLERGLRECDGLIVVYGEAKDSRVERQLLECRKSRAYRDRPFAALGIFEGPPPEAPGIKPPINVYLDGLESYDCRGAANDMTVIEREVRAFLDRLKAQMRPKAA